MNKKSSILIIEDDHVIAERLEIDLRSAGYNVSGVAANLNNAMISAKKKSPDLALIDLKLDGPEDGIVVAQELLKIKWMPIIYITGREEEYIDAVQRSKTTSPVAFLEKPLKMRELLSQIDLALHNFSSGHIAVNANRQRDYITLATGDGYVKIKQSEIIVVDAVGAYSNVFVTSDEAERIFPAKSTNPILTSVGIGRLLPSLAPHFYQISRSQVINVNQIQKIESDQLSLGGRNVIIPEGRRSALLTHLNALKSR